MKSKIKLRVCCDLPVGLVYAHADLPREMVLPVKRDERNQLFRTWGRHVLIGERRPQYMPDGFGGVEKL